MIELNVLFESLIFLSIPIYLISAYLKVNKLWKRKHEKAVSESISLSAMALMMFLNIQFLIKWLFIDKEIIYAIIPWISIVTMVFYSLVGTGLWVKENRHKSFLRLLLKALNLEKREATYLVNALIQPKGPERMLTVLIKLAGIDNEVAEEESRLIHRFAEHWNMKAPNVMVGTPVGGAGLLDLRQSVEDYLKIQPPKEQAAHFIDILNLLVKADGKVTPEEDLILSEITELIKHYVSEDDESKILNEVLVVPQNDAQIDTIKSLLPHVHLEAKQGGQAFSIGRFYSENFAEEICNKYIAQDFFTAFVPYEFNKNF